MKISGLEKNLGDFHLNIDSLTVPGPGIYGLIGPNGSGKSTLAKLMAGLLEPDQGIIDTEGLTSRDITFLPRKPYMMDSSVCNNLVYPLKLRKTMPDSKVTSDFLDKMGFSAKARQRARSLSSGEQQKLALLRALIFRPRLIIADEAMTALDIDSLDLFEKTILEEQKKENSTWIIISHQMPQIKHLCDHLFFMYNGRMEIEGSVEEIFSDTKNPHLKQYLRSYGGDEK